MKHGVVSNEVGKRQRTNGVVHSELHDAVDGFRFGHTFLQGQDGFVDHRAENAVGDKARGIVARQGGFAHLFCRFNNGLIRPVTCAVSIDDFNEFHDGNWIHEVHADDLVRSVR